MALYVAGVTLEDLTFYEIIWLVRSVRTFIF